MRKITVLIVSIFIAATTFAQVTGGGRVTEQSQPVVDQINKKDVFKNTFYVSFATASTKGNMHMATANANDIKRYGYGGMTSGLSIALGSNFYFNNIDMKKIGLSDQFKLGVDVTYSSATICKKTDGELFDFSLLYAAVKVGPVFSYNPIGKLVLDFKLTLQPTLVDYYQEFSFYSYSYSADYKESALGTSFKLRKGLGIYARYQPFMLGFELSWGQVKFKNFELMSLDGFEYGYYDTNYRPNYNYEMIEQALGSTRFDFVFGFSF